MKRCTCCNYDVEDEYIVFEEERGGEWFRLCRDCDEDDTLE